jgi:hypothetical protein
MDLKKPRHMNQGVYDKLKQCEISNSIKCEIIKACSSLDNEDEVKDVFDKLCDKYPLSGDSVNLNKDELLGHIKLAEELYTFLSNALGKEQNFIIKVFMGLSMDSPGPMLQSEIDDFFDLLLDSDSIYISIGNPWLFRAENNQKNPYNTTTPQECLPARLALPDFPSGRSNYIGFTIKNSHVRRSKKPTITDAGYEFAKNIWFPGGNTKPLDHCAKCEKSDGLEEVISQPIRMNKIQMSVVRIEL